MSKNGIVPHLIGGARWEGSQQGLLRLILPPTAAGYANAQMDDYQNLPRRQFKWKPPVALKLRARSSTSEPRGTLGFGFWNDPFSFGQAGASRRLPALPRAVWFFHGSPPHDLQLVDGIAGWGWKASSLDSMKAPFLLPLAPLGLALSLIPILRSPAVRIAQGLLNAAESALEHDLSQWHDYSIHWQRDQVVFMIDGATVLRTDVSPSGPLGFVTWIDNQYMAFSQAKGIKFGILPTAEQQWLEISDLEIKRA
jgi:hypothetical protein